MPEGKVACSLALEIGSVPSMWCARPGRIILLSSRPTSPTCRNGQAISERGWRNEMYSLPG